MILYGPLILALTIPLLAVLLALVVYMLLSFIPFFADLLS